MAFSYRFQPEADAYHDTFAIDLGQGSRSDGRGCWTLTLSDIMERIRKDNGIEIDIPYVIREEMLRYEIPLIEYRPIKEWNEDNSARFVENGGVLVVAEDFKGRFGSCEDLPGNDYYKKLFIVGMSENANFPRYQYGEFLEGGYTDYKVLIKGEEKDVPSYAYITTHYHDLKIHLRINVKFTILYKLMWPKGEDPWNINDFKSGGIYSQLEVYPVISNLALWPDPLPFAGSESIVINGQVYRANDSIFKEPMIINEISREKIEESEDDLYYYEEWLVNYEGEDENKEYNIEAALFENGATARIMRFCVMVYGNHNDLVKRESINQFLYGISQVSIEIIPGLSEIAPTWYRPNENNYNLHINGGTFYDTVNLPDKSQLDFIKSVSKIFGMFPLKSSKGLKFHTYNQLEYNKQKAQDWSEYLITNAAGEAREKTRNTGAKARKLWFRYDKNDDVDASETDYCIDTGDYTAEEYETDYVKVIFSACNNNGLKNVAKIPILTRNTGEAETPFDKWNFNGGSKCYLLESNDYGDRKIFNTPWERLIDKYWGAWARMVTNAVVIKDEFKLPPIVLRDLDMSVPVYLRQYGAFFVIDEITTKENNISEVKLIKMK